MSPTPPDVDELDAVVAFVADEARKYLDAVADRPVRDPLAEETAAYFAGSLAEDGVGAIAALQELVDGGGGLVHSAGPRFFHFVNGGTTPAALGADWLTSTWDQNPGAWVATPLGGHLESVALGWLKELFGLPQAWGGVLTTGATMANFTALACARRWWGLRHGVDIDQVGLGGLPPMPVFGSGYLHPSDLKALAMLGLGRDAVRKLARDGAGRLDLDALEGELRTLGGAPAVVIASAGEVNAGDFDPLPAMADLAERYGAWLHVDGAFGLFAALSDRSRHLVEGVERADSVIADGHKWLNVAYDCGFAFVKDPSLQASVFTSGAAYLPDPLGPKPTWGFLGPEMSRRSRAFAVWATLRAYGRSGYRAIVERHLDLARHLADRVDEAPDLERLADVALNIVCFRFRPPGYEEERLNDLNRRIGEGSILDGRVFFGTTEYDGKVAFRPAPVNWRNRTEDVDLIVDVVRELGHRYG
ncbi:MAG: pyridoxal-dependent decarboxylase [Actinomycetota bacterium]|nr:pyridoxal-dependent decarboxylase [Actinomycetota bacterium]